MLPVDIVFHPLKRIVLLILLSGLTHQSCRQSRPDSEKYLEAIEAFAHTVLEYGRDSYGDRHTPLFVDGLDTLALQPALWKWEGGDTWVLSNFASQQALMRLLDGLSGVTGEDRYREAAEDAAREALTTLRTPNGLLFWGGHSAWDLEDDKPVGEHELRYHEVKNHQPYFRLLWRVNPDATRDLLKAIWGTHIMDWSTLDYNRHGGNLIPFECGWEQEYNIDIEVPFPRVTGYNLSFCLVTPPLLHSGLTLAVLDNDHKALTWSRRLAYRWQQARHPETGLSGGLLSYKEKEGDRAQIALGHVYPHINEAKILASYNQTSRYHDLPLAQMQVGEILLEKESIYSDTGHELIIWASGDLKSYGEQCYDPVKGVFPARMTDGTLIDGEKSVVGYYTPESFAPAAPDGNLIWGYAMAYRLTHDTSHWSMLQSLFRHMDLGELGEPDGSGEKLNRETSSTDWRIIYALLELYKDSGNQAILEQACRITDNLLEWQSTSGLFPRPGRQYARTGDEVPLAILHLVAAIEGKSYLIPDPMLDAAFFHAEYYDDLEPDQQKRFDSRTYDNFVYYGPQ